MFTKNLFKYSLFFIVFIFFLTNNSLQAGTTGKIAGKVYDKKTNEALIGAILILVDSKMGANSDLDGNYFIINIPPGVYDIRVSLIGYAPVLIKNVRVSVDQTSKIDFEMIEQSHQVNDIVVSAGRAMVRKDLTSTETKVNGDNIALLPVDDVQSLLLIYKPV